MHVYILTFILSLILYFLFDRKKGKKNRIFYFSSLPLILISGLRYDVGTDYFPTYYTGFYRILINEMGDGFEIGYILFNKIIQIFTDNVFVLFFLTAVLFVTFTFKGIFNLSTNIPLSIIMLLLTRYFFISMNGVRQFISLAILLCSIKYIIERNLKKYLFFILLAFLFHYTSILFAPCYLLCRLKISKLKFIFISLITVVSSKLIINLIKVLLIGTKYGKLLERFSVCGVKFAILTIFLNIVILFFAYIGYYKRKNDNKYIVFLNLQIISTLIAFVLRVIPLMERVYWIFSFSVIVTLPYLFQNIKNKKIFLFFISALFFVYMIYDIQFLGDHEVIPYNWIYNKKAIFDSEWK